MIDGSWQVFARVAHSVSETDDFATKVLVLGSKLNGLERMMDEDKW